MGDPWWFVTPGGLCPRRFASGRRVLFEGQVVSGAEVRSQLSDAGRR